MADPRLDTLKEMISFIPENDLAGYRHADLYYSAAKDSVYLGCVLVRDRPGSNPSCVIYDIRKPDQSGNPPSAQIPEKKEIKDMIRKGASFLTWEKDGFMFSLVNPSPRPSTYAGLPGLGKSLATPDDGSPKDDILLEDLKQMIMSSPPAMHNMNLFRGMALFPEKSAGWTLVEIGNMPIQGSGSSFLISMRALYRKTSQDQPNDNTDDSCLEIRVVFSPSGDEKALDFYLENHSGPAHPSLSPAISARSSEKHYAIYALPEKEDPGIRALLDDVVDRAEMTFSHPAQHLKK